MKINKLKSILQIADYAAPYPGNFFSSLEALEENLKEKNIRMIYIFPNRAINIEWVNRIIDEKQILFLPGSPIKDVLFLATVLHKYDADIIHTHFCWTKYSFLIKIANLFQGAKTVRHVRSEYLQSGLYIISLFKRWIYNADVLVPCSLDVANELANCGFDSSKIYLVKNGIDFQRLENYQNFSKSDLNIPNDSKTVMMFGYNFYVKGVDIAVKAIDELNKQYCNKVYLLLPLASNIEIVKKEIKKILGSIPEWILILPPRNDISTYIKISDIFLSASRSEGFCNALIENAYNEKIIFYSDIQVQSDLGLKHAIPFKSEDYIDLLKVMKKYLDNEILITQEQLHQQKEFVTKEYALSNWVNEIENVYKIIYR